MKQPRSGPWKFDATASRLTLEVEQFGLLRHRCRFTRFHGLISVGRRGDPERAELVIDATSLKSAFGAAADAIASDLLLQAGRYEAITFTTDRIELDGRRGRADGELTLAGVTRPITLTVTVREPELNGALRLDVRTTVDRRRWGVGELPGVHLGRHVHVAAEMLALDQNSANNNARASAIRELRPQRVRYDTSGV